MRFLKEKSIPYAILTSLKELGSDYAYYALHPPRSVRGALYQMDRRINNRVRRQAIGKLKKQGLLSEYKKDGERYLRITKKGKIEIVRYKLKAKTAESWDKKWRFVIFDIPEATRKDRNFLRGQLKWLGFVELQKSVWVFPYNVKDELREFIKLCKIELRGDIRFLTAEHVEEDSDLRRQFHLK
mgnify:FL=1